MGLHPLSANAPSPLPQGRLVRIGDYHFFFSSFQRIHSMNKPVLLVSLIAIGALGACGKKEEAAPAVVTPPPVVVTPPATAPAASPAADGNAALDEANKATQAAKDAASGSAPK